MSASGTMDIFIACGCELMSEYTLASDLNGTIFIGAPMGNPLGAFCTSQYGV